jgi:DNA-directed RNA polymerase subunit RPC12/RpoP
MDFVFRCPECEQALEVDSGGVGSEIVCPACNHVIVVPPPPAAAGHGPIQMTPRPRSDQPVSLSSIPKSPEAMIQKANRPLEVAAKLDTKKVQVKTIRHSDCVDGGRDTFDATVSAFLAKFSEPQIVSVSPVSYSHFDLARAQVVQDYGVIIVYKS